MTSSRPQTSSCIFCSASRNPNTSDSLLLCKTDRALVMLNRYPYSNGHVMIAPIAHLSRLDESSDEILLPLIRLTAEAQRILSVVYQPHGFNIGMNLGESAGAGIADHYHMHVVPRWNGDTNFMSVTSRTRLVPEELEESYRKLHPHFEALAAGRSSV